MYLTQLKSLLIAAVLLMSACQHGGEIAGNAPLPTPTTVFIPDETSVPALQTIETEISGIEIGISLPLEWEINEYHGLVMVEHKEDDDSDADGMSIYLFVPPMNNFNLDNIDDNENYALTVLEQVVQTPSFTGSDVAISDPQHFVWDSCEAAYYLLTSADGVQSLVMALEVTGENRLVVLNITVPSDQANTIRYKLPIILDGLTINGERLTGSTLQELPNPLPFPVYEPPEHKTA